MTFPRRMIESAAHLVDHVFPEASTRQFVLTFPIPLRFLLAAQPEALTLVLAVVQRGISTFVVQHSGLTVSSGARTGAVTLIQRFGSALNPHLHMLFLDGAYSFSGQRPTFHRARRLPPDELLKLLDSLSRRIVRLLERRGLLIADSEHPALDLEAGSPLDQIQAASLHYRIAFGPHAGRKARADRHAGKASCAQARKPPCRLSRRWPVTACHRWMRSPTIRCWRGSRVFHCMPPPFVRLTNAAAWNECSKSPSRPVRIAAAHAAFSPARATASLGHFLACGQTVPSFSPALTIPR
jgi:hypothetical protein